MGINHFRLQTGKKGWQDHGRSNALYRNEGKGRWKRLPLTMPRTSVHAVCTFDRDKDGNLDLFVASGYRVYGASLEAFPDRLYRGDGQGGFADVTERAGLLTARKPGEKGSSKPTYGVTHGDWNNDGRQDLWVCTYGRQWNFLWADGSEPPRGGICGGGVGPRQANTRGRGSAGSRAGRTGRRGFARRQPWDRRPCHSPP